MNGRAYGMPTFHGNTKTTLPTGVVGTFQAANGNPHPVTTSEGGAIDLNRDTTGFVGVVGSFGARR